MMSQSAVLMIAGNSSLADNILSKKFKEIAPIFGTKIEGPDKFKSTIDGLFSVSALIGAAAQTHHFYPTFSTLQESCSMLSSLQNATNKYEAFCPLCSMGIVDYADFVPFNELSLLQSHSMLVSAELRQDGWHERICCRPRQQQGLHSLGVKGQDGR